MRAALFGGDLFSVATYFYQNHNLKSRAKEAINKIYQASCMQKPKQDSGGHYKSDLATHCTHTGINPAKHLSARLILSIQVGPLKLMEPFKCFAGSGPVPSASCSVKYAEQGLHLIASGFN